MTALLTASRSQFVEWACGQDPAIWAEEKRGFTNSPLHVEWYDLARKHKRLAVVAPREHAKSEIFTVNSTAWDSIYRPGIETFVFANTAEQAKKMKERISSAVEEARPDLVRGAIEDNATSLTFANGSSIAVAGAGKAVRGAHPDVIRGDDVLEEATCLTEHQRKKTARWWFGTVSNMAHPGTTRVLPDGTKVTFGATQITLVGTPFHASDLLMGMRTNEMYRFHRYAAEYDPERLVRKGSLAIEIT